MKVAVISDLSVPTVVLTATATFLVRCLSWYISLWLDMSQGFIVCVCRFTYNWASIVRVCSIFYYTV